MSSSSNGNGHHPINGAKVLQKRENNQEMPSSSNGNGHYPINAAKILQKRENNQEKMLLDKNAAFRACQKDRHYIEKLETELRNCYQEIDYLQDQLNIRNVEANIMGEHIHSLELKLTELEKFPERVRVIDDELMRSDSQCWLLMEEVRCQEEKLKKAALQIEKLENVNLDSQCEIESLKLDLTTLEQRLFDADSFGQHVSADKALADNKLREYELQLQEAQKTIDHLVLENKELKRLFPRGAATTLTFDEQLDKTLEKIDGQDYDRGGAILENMAKRSEESELLIEQLKEELREQKLKAKEDAEDLTQEMAELRYQITGMLEEEYKRRSCIEQAAIQQIQELEAQVSKEQRKLSGALRRLQESHELAQKQSMEIKKLKDSLGVCACWGDSGLVLHLSVYIIPLMLHHQLHVTDTRFTHPSQRFNSALNHGTVCRSCSCGFCAMLLELSNCCIEGPVDIKSSSENTMTPQNLALLQWHPDEAADGEAS